MTAGGLRLPCIFSAIAALFLSVSCTWKDELSYTGKSLPSKLVLNAMLCADSLNHEASLGVSTFLFSEAFSGVVEGASLRVWHNGKPCEVHHVSDKPAPSGAGKATFSFRVKLSPGDQVDMEASATGLDGVKATCTVPFPAQVGQVRTHWGEEQTEGAYRGNYALQFQVEVSDRRASRDGYRLVLRSDGESWWRESPSNPWQLMGGRMGWTVLHDVGSGGIDISQDPVFDEMFDAEPDYNPNPFAVFSDALFADGEYTLCFGTYVPRAGAGEYIPFTPTGEGGCWRSGQDSTVLFYRVEVHALDEGMYNYLHSVSAFQNLTFKSESEPFAIYSNVEGGFGILGCYAVTGKEVTVAN